MRLKLLLMMILLLLLLLLPFRHGIFQSILLLKLPLRLLCRLLLLLLLLLPQLLLLLCNWWTHRCWRICRYRGVGVRSQWLLWRR